MAFSIAKFLEKIAAPRPFSWFGAALCAVACLPLAAALTWLIGVSSIDVALDLVDAPSGAPTLIWGGDSQSAMKRIDDAFGPGKAEYEFTLTALNEQNPESNGKDVCLKRFPAVDELIQTPPGSWGTKELAKTEGLERKEGFEETSIGWSGEAEHLVLHLIESKQSGMVLLKTPKGEEKLDLYKSGENNVLRIALPPKVRRISRFHCLAPRRALAGARIAYPEAARMDVERLYVGSAIPNIFSFRDNILDRTWGWRTPNWDPQRTDDAIVIPSLSPLEQGGIATFFALQLSLFLLLTAAILAVRFGARALVWLLSEPIAARETGPFPWISYAVFSAAFVVVWGFYLAVCYPGAMVYDSANQWNQAHTWNIDNHHPALHTMAVWALTKVWDSPAILSLTQIAAQALAVAFGLAILLQAGIRRAVVWPLFACQLLSPRNGMMSILIVKDVPYAILLLLVICVLIRLLLNSKSTERPIVWISLGVLLGLLPVIRHNGLLILFALSPILPLFFWPRRKFAFLTLAVAFLLFGSIQYGLYPLVKVKPMPRPQTVDLFSDATASLVIQDVPFSQSEYDFLSQIHSFDDKWGYERVNARRTLYVNQNTEFATEHVDEFGKTLFSFCLRYPLLILKHRLEKTTLLYNPFQPAKDERKIETYYGVITPNVHTEKYNLTNQPLVSKEVKSKTMRTLKRTVEKDLIWLFWRPAWHLYAIIFAGVALIWRTRDFRFLLVLLPPLINTASIFIGATAQNQRYQFGVTLSAGFVVALAFLPALKKSKTEDSTEAPPERRTESL